MEAVYLKTIRTLMAGVMLVWAVTMLVSCKAADAPRKSGGQAHTGSQGSFLDPDDAPEETGE